MTIFGTLRSSTERAGGNFSVEKYSVPENRHVARWFYIGKLDLHRLYIHNSDFRTQNIFTNVLDAHETLFQKEPSHQGHEL